VSSDDDDDDDVYGKRSCWQLLLNFLKAHLYEFGGLRCATNTLQKRNLKQSSILQEFLSNLGIISCVFGTLQQSVEEARDF
jgi:hypothetical protein